MGNVLTARRVATAAVALAVTAAPLAVPTSALADPAQAVIVTMVCDGLGTLQVEGLPNAAAAYQVVGSDQYHTFVVHWFQVLQNGQVIATAANGTQGQVGPLYSCTSQQGSLTVDVQAQVL